MSFSFSGEHTYPSGDSGDAPDVLVGVIRRPPPGPGDKHRKAGPAQARGFIRPVIWTACARGCRWLERSNLAVAAATGVMYLEAAGITVEPAREDALALKDLLLDPACTAGKIAALLRGRPTAT